MQLVGVVYLLELPCVAIRNTILCMKNKKQTKAHLVWCMHLLVFLSETQNDMHPCDYYMCMKNAKQK